MGGEGFVQHRGGELRHGPGPVVRPEQPPDHPEVGAICLHGARADLADGEILDEAVDRLVEGDRVGYHPARLVGDMHRYPASCAAISNVGSIR